MGTLPERWVSIDPGDVHVGFATWVRRDCIQAVELNPRQCVSALKNLLGNKIVSLVVCEKFALYGWNEKSMAGNEFLTCQLIGVIKYLCDEHDVPYVGQFASEHKRIYKLGWFTSMTRAEQRAMPYAGNGGHAKDAWVAGEWFARKREQA